MDLELVRYETYAQESWPDRLSFADVPSRTHSFEKTKRIRS